jgi:hypothetical protein
MSMGFRKGNYKTDIEQSALTVFRGNISISYNFAATVFSAVNFNVKIQFLGEATPYWLVYIHQNFEDSITLRKVGNYLV